MEADSAVTLAFAEERGDALGSPGLGAALQGTSRHVRVLLTSLRHQSPAHLSASHF